MTKSKQRKKLIDGHFYGRKIPILQYILTEYTRCVKCTCMCGGIASYAETEGKVTYIPKDNNYSVILECNHG